MYVVVILCLPVCKYENVNSDFYHTEKDAQMFLVTILEDLVNGDTFTRPSAKKESKWDTQGISIKGTELGGPRVNWPPLYYTPAPLSC